MTRGSVTPLGAPPLLLLLLQQADDEGGASPSRQYANPVPCVPKSRPTATVGLGRVRAEEAVAKDGQGMDMIAWRVEMSISTVDGC